jgi:alanine racemase
MSDSSSVFCSTADPCARISLGALRNNIRVLKGQLPRDTAFTAVVKSDAYGHGIEAVSRVAMEEGCAFLVVHSVTEADELRRSIPDAPILICGPILPIEAARAVGAGYVVFVGNVEVARALDAAGKAQGIKARGHLKVDTGMGRFGFLDASPGFADDIAEVLSMKGIDWEGVATHFSESDDTESRYTQEQTQRFREVLRLMTTGGARPRWVHAANSGGILHFPETAFSLVRMGIAMYGVSPGSRKSQILSHLQPVMTLACRVADVREIPEGTPISYGRTYVTTRPSRLALLPVGYGNGYPRSASSKSEVLVRGCHAPVLGRVTMNIIVVDATDIEGIRVGDPVLLFGREGEETHRVEKLAEAADMIPYEILCNVGRATPRIVVTD